MSLVSKVFRPWVWVLLAAVPAYVIQLWPTTGILPMMMLGILWPGALIHAGMIFLAVDVFTRNTHRAFLVLPVALYAAGLGAFAISHYDAHTLSQHLARQNSGVPIAFDPATDAVVFSDAAVYLQVQSSHKLDLAYANDLNHGWIANRVMPRAQCPDRVLERQWRVVRTGFTSRGVRVTNACMLRSEERYEGVPITVTMTRSEQPWGFHTAAITRTEIRRGAEYRIVYTGQTKVFPIIPIIIAGCGIEQGGWGCAHGLWTDPSFVGGVEGPGESRLANAVAHGLGLELRNVVRTGRSEPFSGPPGTIDFATN